MKQIRIDLQMGGKKVSTLESLRECATEDLLTFFEDGRLKKWLQSRGLQELMGGIENIRRDGDSVRLMQDLCVVLGVKVPCENSVRQWVSEYEFAKAESYEKEAGEKTDLTEAFRLFRRAADLDHGRALDAVCDQKYFPMTNHGVLVGRRIECESGALLTEEAVTKFALYKKAAEAGRCRGQVRLGECYLHGIGVERNPVEALKYYRLAAEQGDVEAQFVLGECYRSGVGLEKSAGEAVKWYRLAAEQGKASAQYRLGECYEKGDGVDKFVICAADWYRRAAQQDCVEAQYGLSVVLRANTYLMFRDTSEAMKWLLVAAEKGLASAQYDLGCCYYSGKEGVAADNDVAVKWFHLASEQGFAEATEKLADCYSYGFGVKRDPQTSDKYRELAQKQRIQLPRQDLKDLLNSVIGAKHGLFYSC